MKVVINRSFGGFCIPDELVEELGWHSRYFNGGKNLPRDYDEHTDENLIKALEHMIENGEEIKPLNIVEIPDDVDWYISDYDGIETIHEKHRSWC